MTATALLVSIDTSASLVSLLLLGYAGVSQLFPGVVLGLFSRRVTGAGVFAGLATGISVASILILTGRDPYNGFNAGFIGLCCNFAVTAAVSLLTTVRVAGFDDPVPVLRAPAASRPV